MAQIGRKMNLRSLLSLLQRPRRCEVVAKLRPGFMICLSGGPPGALGRPSQGLPGPPEAPGLKQSSATEFGALFNRHV